MKIVDEATLDLFRGRLRDEVTGEPGWCQPHHILSRGMGGAGRLDVRLNLLAVTAQTHDRIHRGLIARDALLDIVARREGLTADAVRDELFRLLREPAPSRASQSRKAKPRVGAARDVLRTLLRELADGPCAGVGEAVAWALELLGGRS